MRNVVDKSRREVRWCRRDGRSGDYVTLGSAISSIPDYSGIRIKDRRGGDIEEVG